MDRKEIQDRLEQNRKALKELDKKYLKAFAPEGYKSGTSLEDFDMIHGSRKEYRIEEYYKEKQKIETLIELDEGLLSTMISIAADEDYLKLLDSNIDKVKYLRKVKGYTQSRTAEIIGISTRYVQKLEKTLK